MSSYARVFLISCPECRWQSDMPVSEAVALKFREYMYCLECASKGMKVPFQFKEVVQVGYGQHLPLKEEVSHGED